MTRQDAKHKEKSENKWQAYRACHVVIKIGYRASLHPKKLKKMRKDAKSPMVIIFPQININENRGVSVLLIFSERGIFSPYLFYDQFSFFISPKR